MTTVCTSLSCNATDDLPQNHHFTRLVVSAENTRFHRVEPQLTALLHKRHWIQRKLDEQQSSSLPNLLQVQSTINTTAHGELPFTRVQLLRLTTSVNYAGLISPRLGNHNLPNQWYQLRSCIKPVIKSTTCFNPHHRWQEYRTSWPPKDVTGDSSHYLGHHFGGRKPQ